MAPGETTYNRNPARKGSTNAWAQRHEDRSLLRQFADLGLQRAKVGRHALEDRWPSVLQAGLGAGVAGDRRRPERTHHGL